MKILAGIYFIITRIKNLLYDKNILKSKELSGAQVICVGNITVGGTGKTPCVQYLAKRLLASGRRVAIVSRGYKGKRDHEPLLVRDYDNIVASSTESGDEPYLHALNLNIPIVVGANRYKACAYLLDNFSVDTIILDDGFQHRKLKRDRDIVLIDATSKLATNSLLPKGTLREPLKDGLKRASEFIITKSDLVTKDKLEELKAFLALENKNISLAIHKVDKLYNTKNISYNLDTINNARVLLFSGLANPENFEKTVAGLNPKKITRMDYRDHHDFTEKDIMKIKSKGEELNTDFILTTEKDLVKLKDKETLSNLLILGVTFDLYHDNLLK